MSITICFGSYGGFHVVFGGEDIFRLCLGWMAITVWTVDIEDVITKLLKEHRSKSVEHERSLLRKGIETLKDYGKFEWINEEKTERKFTPHKGDEEERRRAPCELKDRHWSK